MSAIEARNAVRFRAQQKAFDPIFTINNAEDGEKERQDSVSGQWIESLGAWQRVTEKSHHGAGVQNLLRASLFSIQCLADTRTCAEDTHRVVGPLF